MANIFFVHTPMQLFMAQQIINQEGLKDNVMVYDYAGFNSYYQDSYDLISIPESWSKCVLNPVRLKWNVTKEKRRFFSSVKEIRQKLKILENFVEDEKANTVYFGDILNCGYRVLAHLFHKKGLRIGFFEEGFSHYTGRVVGGPTFSEVVKTIMIDMLVYLPLYHDCFEYKARYIDNNINRIPQDVRYSLIPYYHEKFDKLVKPALILSPTLEEYMNRECAEINEIKQNGSIVLFVNEEIYHFVKGIDSSIEEQLLQECVFAKLPKNSVVLLKYHPSENEERKKQVADYFEKNGVKYYVLSKGLNVPVEYYLQMYSFYMIFTYATAVSLYNGYLFPHTHTIRLLDDLKRICEQHGIKDTKRLSGIISRLDGVQNIISKGIVSNVG